MYRFSPSNFNIKEISVLLFPLGLWVLLWLSLNSGNLLDIYHPTDSQSFIHGIRAAFPLLAALLHGVFGNLDSNSVGSFNRPHF